MDHPGINMARVVHIDFDTTPYWKIWSGNLQHKFGTFA